MGAAKFSNCKKGVQISANDHDEEGNVEFLIAKSPINGWSTSWQLFVVFGVGQRKCSHFIGGISHKKPLKEEEVDMHSKFSFPCTEHGLEYSITKCNQAEGTTHLIDRCSCLHGVFLSKILMTSFSWPGTGFELWKVHSAPRKPGLRHREEP